MKNNFLKKSAQEAHLVFIDVETTGLSPKNGDCVCEIGALKAHQGKALCEFQTLINPQMPMPYEAYVVHRICDTELKSAPLFTEVAHDLIHFLEDTVICAYNAKFDIGFLNCELVRIGKKPLTNHVIDVLLMARALVRSDRYNLETVASKFNIFSAEGLHRAIYDCRVTAKVFYKLIGQLNDPPVQVLIEKYGKSGIK
jgi:DNA polymerase III epsilon subunit